MGWMEWTGWKTGFFRMSESVFTEGSSWFLLMICSASCVLPTRQVSVKKPKIPFYDTWSTVQGQSWWASPGPRPGTAAVLPLQWNADMATKSSRQQYIWRKYFWLSPPILSWRHQVFSSELEDAKAPSNFPKGTSSLSQLHSEALDLTQNALTLWHCRQ